MVIDYDDIKSNPEQVLNSFANFLGVKEDKFRNNPNQVIHKGNKISFSEEALNLAKESYQEYSEYYKRWQMESAKEHKF